MSPRDLDTIQPHHTGYVVSNLDDALAQWCLVTGATVERASTLVSAHRVRVCFLRISDGRIELVQPAADDAATGSRTREPSAPDHVCYLCDDLDERIKRAREQGGLVVRPPVRSEAFDGRRMSFVYYRGVGLIEWVEKWSSSVSE